MQLIGLHLSFDLSFIVLGPFVHGKVRKLKKHLFMSFRQSGKLSS